MKKFTVSMILIIFSGICMFAANKQPQARMRVYKNCQDVEAKCFVIEVFMPESISDAEHGAYSKKDDKRLQFAQLFQGDDELDYKLELSENDKLLAEDRQGRLFVFFLPKNFWDKKSLDDNYPKMPKIHFSTYPLKDTLARKTKNYQDISVDTDFSVAFEFESFNRIFRQKVVMKNKPFDCDDDEACDEDVKKIKDGYMQGYYPLVPANTTDFLPGFLGYIQERQREIIKWFRTIQNKRNDLTSKIDLRIENLNKCPIVLDKEGTRGCISDEEWVALETGLGEPKPVLDPIHNDEYAMKVREYLINKNAQGAKSLPPAGGPGNNKIISDALEKFENTKSNELIKRKKLTLKDIDPTTISGVITNVSREYDDKPYAEVLAAPLLIKYKTDVTLPSKFNALLRFNDSEIPFEMANNFKKTSVEIAQITVNSSEETKEVGKRELPDKLDAAILFGSSVEEKDKTVNGVATKVRERTTRATLDLRLQPFKAEPFFGSQNVRQWTPFYLDMKVSTGKIDKDTLSLNRIEFGTKFDFTKYYPFETKKPRVSTNPDYLNLSVKLVHASDRDFKQLEYKATAELQPRLAIFNRIPANVTSTVNTIIKADDDKIPFREVSPTWGYKMMPVFGGEIGKTWFRRRPADIIKPTDFIRRLYVGFDTTFYLSSQATLSFTDKYYFNFGKRVDKRENYFKGTFDFGLRKRFGYGDSFFISFERGNQPPFNTPNVNAVKIGYRFVNPRFTVF